LKTLVKNTKSSTLRRALSTRGLARVSVVVPIEPGGDPGACLDALARLPAGDKACLKELILAWGRNPSRQRNLAVASARGEFILFLDSDSRAQAGLVPALLDAIAGEATAAAGGPNLPLEDESPLGLRFDAVLGSYAGSMSSRARYRPIGHRRRGGEKELILCNLLMRRKAFLQAGGFREDLYPNEENELFNRLQSSGWNLVYEPKAWVRRPRRGSVAAFTAQSFRYGRGRARQMRKNFFPGDLLNLLPLALPLLWLACLAAAACGLGARPAWLPALAYAAACLLASGLRPSVALFLMLRHHAYAAGLLAGLAREAEPNPGAVRLQRLEVPASAGRPRRR
jgi:hypothetical protein